MGDAEFMQWLLNKNEKMITLSVHITLLCIDDVLLILNNSKFGDYVGRIYPIQLEINDTARFAAYFDIHI